METLAWFEQTAFSIGVREIPWVFPFVLIVHSIAMGFAVGAALAVDLRALGLAPGVRFEAILRFLPTMWTAFVVNIFSGLILLAGYPAKALTNPVFYLKLALLGGALWATQRLTGFAARPASRRSLAIASLLMWGGVIFAGRFLAYTHSVLLAYWEI